MLISQVTPIIVQTTEFQIIIAALNRYHYIQSLIIKIEHYGHF
jgi:hypothetical protein